MYFQAYNTGDGFITHEDRARFEISGKPLDLWWTDGSQAAQDWATRNNATPISTAEAEALIAALPVQEMPL